MTLFSKALRKFSKDETGVISLEGIIMIPFLVASILASVVFVDAFRMQSLNLRATYVISDAVSRLWDPVTDDYFDGLWNLHGLQVNFSHPTDLRMTVVQWSEDDDQYLMRWSASSDTAVLPYLDQTDIDNRKAIIPELADGDTLVLVETAMDYTPPFMIGLPEMLFSNYIFVSPRFTPQIDYTDSTSSSS